MNSIRLLSIKKLPNIFSRLRTSALFRDSFWAIVGGVFGKGLAFVGGIIIARLLGSSTFGEYSVIRSTLTYIAIISTFGLGYTATKFIAEYVEISPSKVNHLIRMIKLITVITGLFFTILQLVCAEEIAERTPGSFIPSQFTNPANPEAHRLTTGPEIYRDLDGKVDAFVAGVGTGGSITGVGEFLKSKNPDCYIVAVEPECSAVLSGKSAGPHKLQGIGAGFIPEILNTEIFNEIIAVTAENAYEYSRLLGRQCGVLVGISSGAALSAATELSKRAEMKDKNIVVLLPDGGERYLSSELYG